MQIAIGLIFVVLAAVGSVYGGWNADDLTPLQQYQQHIDEAIGQPEGAALHGKITVE